MQINNLLTEKEAEKIYSKKKLFGKGKRGEIYIFEFEGKKFAVKKSREDVDVMNNIKNEAFFNQIVNQAGIGPKLLFYDEERNYLIREFVEGDNFKSLMENPSKHSKESIKKITMSLLEQARVLDVKGINKFELNHPYKDILIRKQKPVIIDFERCRFTRNPKNVTQVCQFITSSNFSEFLGHYGVIIQKRSLMKLCVAYKKDFSEKNYEKITEKIEKKF